MRLGGRLTGRVVTRSKARGGDSLSSDSELLPAVLAQATSDPTAACKTTDITRKPPLQVAKSAAVSSARLAVTSGTTAAAAAPPPLPASAAPASSKPRHQRSNSTGSTPKGLQLQADIASDLACIADTLVKACADQQDDVQLPAALSGSQRKSARLAGTTAAPAAPSVLDSIAAKHPVSSSSKALNRASAPARQHKRVPASQLADTNGIPAKKAPAAAAARLETPSPAPPQAAADSPGLQGRSSSGSSSGLAGSSQGRRVRFASGPLDPELHPNSTQDGHPASEGALAVPVRRVPVSYGMDLSRGNVLMLEQLLGSECTLSVTRLKRRVGLLPPIRPPRPYANSPGEAPAAGNGQHGKR